MTSAKPATTARTFSARVAENRTLCREHLRLTLAVPGFPDAVPGQFVHIGAHVCGSDEQGQRQVAGAEAQGTPVPFLRRAFSIAGRRPTADGSEIDLIYRMVGAGTGWMSGLRTGDLVDGIGPLGNGFTVPPRGAAAWLVAGGVGLPPLLWLAQELHQAGHRLVFFLGARSSELIALDVLTTGDAVAAREIPGLPIVLSTDDGSIGFHGTVVDALNVHAQTDAPRPADVIVYTCGPESMMRAVADLCRERGLACQACLERAMACGIGVCQSCVVPVADASDAQGWHTPSVAPRGRFSTQPRCSGTGRRFDGWYLSGSSDRLESCC